MELRNSLILYSMKKHGLGKGLSALISSYPGANQQFAGNTEISEQSKGINSRQIVDVSPDAIIANPYQPRDYFEEKKLEELKVSIQIHGILSPLVVTKRQDGNYELIAGERRLRAARLAKLTRVPVLVRDAGDQEKLELSLIENLQREDLNPIERAIAYKRLLDEFGQTQEKLAGRLGKSRSLIANTVRLVDLPQEIQDSLAQAEISEGHAKALLSIDTMEKQLELWKKITLHKMTVRVAEREAKNVQVQKHMRKVFAKDPQMQNYEDKMEERFGTKVTIKGSKDKGSIIIDYFSLEELERIAGAFF